MQELTHLRARTRRAFADYLESGYGVHILPVVPPGAPISPLSTTLKADKLGKTPGKWTPDGYVGFRAWPEHEATADDVQRWDSHLERAKVPPSIGLQGRGFPAVDIDVDDPTLAARMKALVLRVLGAAPARHTTSAGTNMPGARCAVFYRSAMPLASWVIKLQSPSGGAHMVEFKASKAQVVVDGAHAKGGSYVYPDGPDLVEWGAGNLIEITPDLSSALHAAILVELVEADCVVVSDARSGTSLTASTRRGVSAPSIAHVQAALAAAPNADDIDRDEWVKVAHNVKGACVGLEEDGFDLFATWAEDLNPFENIESLWDGLPEHPRTGYPELARWAQRRSKGAFKPDLSEFVNDNADMSVARAAAIAKMFETQIWVENQERVFDLRDRRLRNRLQFNAHLTEIGKKMSVWEVFMAEPDKPTPLFPTARRQTVFDITYLPGEGQLVGEGLDRRLNLWRPPEGIPTVDVTDDDVRPWLDHVRLIVSDAPVRDQFLDWMASVVQRQTEKPNHGVVIGGKHGIGKSMLIEPFRVAIGLHNVQEILASELDNSFSGWLAQAKLFVVEEMMNFNKKEMMQRLKTYLAAPPHTLLVNPKYGKVFTIPNLVAGLFFTNHADAVAIEAGERRFFIMWSDAPKQPASYFAELARWYKEGGAALAARWLYLRDISNYNMLGEAPHTAARDEMRQAGRSRLDELIESAIEDHQWPLSADLVALDDVRAWVSRKDLGPQTAPTAARVRKALVDAGAVLAHPSGRRPALGQPPAGAEYPPPECSQKQARLLAVRNHHRYVGKPNAELVSLFWAQRAAAYEAPDEVA